MRAKVTPQTNLLADGSDELPSLTTANGFSEIVGLCVEEKEMFRIAGNFGVSRKILLENFSDTCVDKDFMTFAPFLLFDLKTVSETFSIIHKMTDPQT